MAAFNKLSLLVLLLLSVVVLSSSVVDVSDPELKQCRHQCGHQKGFDETQKRQCEQECKEYVRRKREEERRERERDYERRSEETTERRSSPYVFEDEHFETSVKTEEGRVHILRKFTEKSKLLKGIENYRIGFLEANPNNIMRV